MEALGGGCVVESVRGIRLIRLRVPSLAGVASDRRVALPRFGVFHSAPAQGDRLLGSGLGRLGRRGTS